MFIFIVQLLPILFVAACDVFNLPNITYNAKTWFAETYRPQYLKLSLTFPAKLQDLQFSGDLELQFTVDIKVNSLVLQATVDDISDIKIFENENQSRSLYENHVYNKNEGEIFISCTETLDSDSFYTLFMKFESAMRQDYTGFYIVPYLHKGKEEYLMSTKFKPNHARKAFPFWDKAGIWTNFYLTVIHHQNFIPIFNTKKDRMERINSTIVKTIFTRTDLMPIYQFSLSLVRFDSLETGTSVRTLKVFGSDLCQDQFTLTIGQLLQPNMQIFVETYLPNKYDILKLPTDAKVTSDDNLAAAVFPEHSVEISDSDASVIDQVEIALRIGRAYAHHYFGGRLCIASWSDLWLNDGFSNWLSYLILDQVQPEWNVYQFFLVFEYQKALLAESSSAVPLFIPNTDTNLEYVENGELNKLFSSKAASFIRMVENHCGKERFHDFMKNYVRFNYRIVTTDYFIEELVDDFGSSIPKDFFNNWLASGGCPLLTLTRDYSSGLMRIMRSSFPQNQEQHEWWLPFNIIAASRANFTSAENYYNMLPNVSELFIKADEVSSDTTDWMLLNAQQTGYHRTNYDLINWKLLSHGLATNHTIFHVNNRAQLIDDSFRLAEVNILPFDVPLSLSLYLKYEKDFAPWATVNNMLSTIELLVDERESQNLFNFYVQKLTQPIYDQIGLTESSNDSTILKASRGIISHWACKTWNPECFCTAKQLYQEYLKKNVNISPNFQKTVLCTGIGVASRPELELTLEKFLQSKSKHQQMKLISLLGCSKDEDFLADWIRRSFQTTPTFEDYKPEWTQIIPNIVDNGPHAVRAAINTLKLTTHRELLAKEGALYTSVKSIAKFIHLRKEKAPFFSLLDDLMEKKFISKEDLEELKSQVDINIDWAEKNKAEIFDWLRDLRKDSGADYVTYSNDRQPSCVTPFIPRSCECGCACENGANSVFATKNWIWLAFFIKFLADSVMK